MMKYRVIPQAPALIREFASLRIALEYVAVILRGGHSCLIEPI